jgi:excisionase family DNA binding protein
MNAKSHVTVTQAAEITKIKKRTLQQHIKSGKLSALKDEAGNYRIDKAELYRVYPESFDPRTEAQGAQSSENTAQDTHDKTQIALIEKELEHLKEMLAEKKAQIEFLKEQLIKEGLEKSKLLETLSSNQRLLEHKTQQETPVDSDKKRKKFLGIF